MSSSLVCPHAERCSGCALIRQPYPEQLAWKRDLLWRSLSAYAELSDLSPAPTVSADAQTRYRVRAKLVTSQGALGLFARGTHDVVDIPDCRVLSPNVARVAAAIRESLPLPFMLFGVDIREVDAGALVTWVVAEDTDQALVAHATARLVAREPLVVGVAVSRRASSAARLLVGVPRQISGVTSAPHRLVLGQPFQEVTFGSFVQAHPGQASRLYAAVQSALSARLGDLRGVSVLELYAGSGALALTLAGAGAVVTAVESFEPAASSITRAARAQGISLSALALSAEAALDRATGVRAVVLNPPRRGLSPEVRLKLGKLRPEVLVYVSCAPATLARDLSHLARLGLGVELAVPFDMIPLSDAVEALVVLVPRPAPAPRLLYEDDLLVAVDKPPFLPTTPQGEHTDSLLARVRQLSGLANAVPVHRLDSGTSGVCLFARSPESANVGARALSSGTKDYLTLLRGIVRPKGSIHRPLRDGLERRDALTRYRRTRVIGTHSLVRAQPEHGRQHQIRRHFASLTHPVLGDPRYGDRHSNRYFAERHGLDRPFLHAESITLTFGERKVRINAELAPDLVAVLVSLEAP